MFILVNLVLQSKIRFCAEKNILGVFDVYKRKEKGYLRCTEKSRIFIIILNINMLIKFNFLPAKNCGVLICYLYTKLSDFGKH